MNDAVTMSAWRFDCSIWLALDNSMCLTQSDTGGPPISGTKIIARKENWFTQSQKMYLVLYLAVRRVNKNYRYLLYKNM